VKRFTDATRTFRFAGEVLAYSNGFQLVARVRTCELDPLERPDRCQTASVPRDLVIGSGLEFEDRGAHELKGVPGEWHLLAVASA
jgi:hypothetical protein